MNEFKTYLLVNVVGKRLNVFNILGVHDVDQARVDHAVHVVDSRGQTVRYAGSPEAVTQPCDVVLHVCRVHLWNISYTLKILYKYKCINLENIVVCVGGIYRIAYAF